MLCPNPARTRNKCKLKLKITIIRRKHHSRIRCIHKYCYLRDNLRRNQIIVTPWTITIISAITSISMCPHRQSTQVWVWMSAWIWQCMVMARTVFPCNVHRWVNLDWYKLKFAFLKKSKNQIERVNRTSAAFACFSGHSSHRHRRWMFCIRPHC